MRPAPNGADSSASGSDNRVSERPATPPPIATAAPGTPRSFRGSHGEPQSASIGMVIVGIVAVVAVIVALAFAYRVMRKRETHRQAKLRPQDSPFVRPTDVLTVQHNAECDEIQVDFCAASSVEMASTIRSTVTDERSVLSSSHCSKASMELQADVEDNAAAQSLARLYGETLLSKRIPCEELAYDEILGQGRHTQVHVGWFDGQQVAIKSLLPSFPVNQPALYAFVEEIEVAAMLQHPQIVAFCGVAWDEERWEKVAMVSEFMAGGDLQSYLAHLDGIGHARGMDLTKVNIALQMMQGLRYLHSLNPVILHRNFKSSNILLTSDFTAKLSDIGGLVQHQWSTLSSGISVSLWMAPEVVIGGQYNESSDMYSFGVILSELDTQRTPYARASTTSKKGMSATTVLRKVATGKLVCEFSPTVHPKLAALGQACLALEPAERPSASEAMILLQQVVHEMQRKSDVTARAG